MIIKVRVVPRAKKEKIERFNDGLKVYVKKPAVENEANRRLIEVLAAYLKVKKSSLSIIKGHSTRDKLIEIV